MTTFKSLLNQHLVNFTKFLMPAFFSNVWVILPCSFPYCKNILLETGYFRYYVVTTLNTGCVLGLLSLFTHLFI